MFTHGLRVITTVVCICVLTGVSVSVAKPPPRPSRPDRKPKLRAGKKPQAFRIPGRSGLDTIRWDQKTVHAIDIEPEKLKPLYSVGHIRIKDQPLLWMNDKQEVVGDKRYLSDLRVLRYSAVHDLKKGDRGIVIGKVNTGIALPPSKVVELLICSEIVRCRSMRLAGARLDRESTDKEGYHAWISGSDTYFTNSARTVSFTFGLRIDKYGTIRMTKE